MGKKDIHVSDYLDYNPFFADITNGYFFNGEQIIDPNQLKNEEKELLNATMVHAKRVVRDNVKKYYGDSLLCIYVLEQQDSIDYHMIIRNMVSESMEYQKQWNKLRKKHMAEKTLKPGAEFLSGMKKTDRFIPVISLVVYYGEEKWDAARCLHDLLDLEKLPPSLINYIENYHIHVFDYHDYDTFDMFHTELRQIFSFLKHSFSKTELQNFLAEHREEYYNISKEACELLATLTHTAELFELNKHTDEKKGGINMCKAFEEMRLEGLEEGIRVLVTDYQEEGFSKAKILAKLQKGFSLSQEQAEKYYEKYTLTNCTV